MKINRSEKTCVICETKFMGTYNSIVCSPECFTKKRIRSKFTGGIEGVDYILCPVCNEPAKEISNLHAKMHGFETPKLLAEHYDMAYTKCEKIRNRMKGANNPGYQHGGRLSPWSDKSEVHSKEQILEAKEKAAENGLRKDYNRPSMKAYWIKQGQTDQEASQSAKLHNLRDLNFFKRKYGEVLGIEKWTERQEKWHKSMKKSGLHAGYSKTSFLMFEQIEKLYNSKLFYGKSEISVRGNLKVYAVDCLEKDKRKIIEFFGDYWHANPVKYDQHFSVRGHIAKNIWEYDKQKITDLENAGYSVKIVWEKDYRNNPDKIVEECLKFLQ